MIWLMRRLDWKHETLRHSMGVGRGEAGWLDGTRAATAHLSVVMVCRKLVGWSIRYHARAGEYCTVVMLVIKMLCPTRGPGMPCHAMPYHNPSSAPFVTLLSRESVRAWVLARRTRQA